MDDKQRVASGKRVTLNALLLNTILCLFKLTAGFTGRSQAMIADGIHSFSDAVTDIVVIFGLVLGNRPKDRTHPYGHGKFETIAAASLGLGLLLVAFKIGYSAFQSLSLKTVSRPGLIALLAAIVSIIVKEGLYRYTILVGKKINSLACVANAWHHRSDAFSSIAALVGIGAARAGFPIFDPLAAMVVCLFIVKVSVDIIKSSFTELVETSVDAETIERIEKIARSHKEVISVHGIKARRVGPKIAAELHLVLDSHINLLIAHDIAEEVEKEIVSEIKNIDEVLIHTDPKK